MGLKYKVVNEKCCMDTIPAVFFVIGLIAIITIHYYKKGKIYPQVIDGTISIGLLFICWLITIWLVNPQQNIVNTVLTLDKLNLDDTSNLIINLTNLNYFLIQFNTTLLGFVFVVIVFLYKDKRIPMGLIQFGLLTFFIVGYSFSFIYSFEAIIKTYSNPITKEIIGGILSKTNLSITESLQSFLIAVTFFMVILVMLFADVDKVIDHFKNKK